MKITFLDLETTDKTPSGSEILTAYLRTRNLHDFSIIDDLYLTFRPENYKHDSFKIHGISYSDCQLFNDKWDSFQKLLRYIARYKDSLYCCHANYSMYGVHGYFDEQVIRQMAFDRTVFYKSDTYWWYQGLRLKWISTHTISKKKLNLDNYGLDKICSYFGYDFKHHDCIEDVKACEFIFEKLVNKEIKKEDLLNLGRNDNGEGYSIRQFEPIQAEGLFSSVCLREEKTAENGTTDD